MKKGDPILNTLNEEQIATIHSSALALVSELTQRSEAGKTDLEDLPGLVVLMQKDLVRELFQAAPAPTAQLMVLCLVIEMFMRVGSASMALFPMASQFKNAKAAFEAMDGAEHAEDIYDCLPEKERGEALRILAMNTELYKAIMDIGGLIPSDVEMTQEVVPTRRGNLH